MAKGSTESFAAGYRLPPWNAGALRRPSVSVTRSQRWGRFHFLKTWREEATASCAGDEYKSDGLPSAGDGEQRSERAGEGVRNVLPRHALAGLASASARRPFQRLGAP